MELLQKAKRLQGPVLVLGASGFIGANLIRTLLKARADVYGTATQFPCWRLEGIDEKNVITTDLLVDSNIDTLLDKVRPRTIFNCVAYGAYSFETDARLIYQTNFNFTARLLERLKGRDISCYIHAGSSSEYGDNSAGPAEDDLPAPNVQLEVAAARAMRTHGVDAPQVERARDEPVRSRGERADRADLHGVAGERRAEILARGDRDLLARAAREQLDEAVPRDLVAEPRAPRAEDASLAVEAHER